jgi:hypothetical protein
VAAPGNDGNASIPEEIKPPNPWRKMMMMMNSKRKLDVFFSAGIQKYVGDDVVD